MKNQFWKSVVPATALAMLFCFHAQAGTIFWKSNATSTAWSAGANWVGGTAPANDLTSDVAVFSQTSYLNQPDAGTCSVKGIQIGNGTTAAADLTISGTSLSIGSGGITLPATIGSGATINTPITLGTAQIWSATRPLTVAGPITNNSNTLTIDGGGDVGMVTISGSIGAGTGGLIKNGSCLLTLSGTNAYSGPTTVNSGQIWVNSDSAFGTGILELAGQAIVEPINSDHPVGNDIILTASTCTLGSSSAGTSALNFTLNGSFTNFGGNNSVYVPGTGTVKFQGNIYLSESPTIGRTLSLTGGNIAVNGVISDYKGNGAAGNLAVGAHVALNCANTYSGTTVINGVISVGNNAAFGSSTVSFQSGWISSDGAPRTIPNDIVLSGSASSNLVLTGSENLTLTGNLSNSGADHTLLAYGSGVTTFQGQVALSESTTAGHILTLTPNNLVISGPIVNATGGIGLPGSIVVNGNGHLTLSGNNAYSGSTTLVSGLMSVASDSAFGTGPVVLSGGSIEASGASHTISNPTTLKGWLTIVGAQDLVFSGNMTCAASDSEIFVQNSSATKILGNVYLSDDAMVGRTLSINLFSGQDLTIAGVIADNAGTGVAGNLVCSGSDSGSLVLTGNNTYTGTTTNHQFLSVGNGGTSGSLGSGPMVNTGFLTINRSDSITIGNVFSGTGSFIQAGTGTTTLTGTGSSFGGGITVMAGTLQAGNAGAFGSGTSISVAPGAKLGTFGLASVSLGPLSGTGSIQNGGTDASTVSLTGKGGLATYNGTFDDGGAGKLSVSVTGSGTYTLGGNSTYTGITSITAGAILNVSSLGNGGIASNIGASANAATNLVIDGATLKYTGGSASTDRLFSLGTAGGTLDSSGSGALSFTNGGGMGFNGQLGARTLTLAGTFSGVNLLAATITDNGGPTSVLMSGSGTWALSGTNTYTGTTTVTGGFLSLSLLSDGGNPSNIGAADNSAANIVLDGGRLRYTGSAVSTDRLFSVGTLAGGIDSSGSGAMNFTNTGSIGFNGESGSRSLVLSGTNADDNTFSALVSDNGGATAIAKSGSGKWILTALNICTGTAAVSGGTLSISNLADGGVPGNIGAGSVLSLSLNGVLQYTGPATSTNKQLSLGLLGGMLDASGTGPVSFTNTGVLGFPTGQNGARTLTLTGTNTGGNTLATRIANHISDTTSLLKSGPGLWILTGTNGYTGVTTIAGGTLSIAIIGNGGAPSNIGSAPSSAAALVLDGGTLQYTGSGGSTDRLFTVGANGGTVDASGTGALTFTGTGNLVGAGGGGVLTLSGGNAGNNSLAAKIDGTAVTALVKSGTGLWKVTGANTFTGGTTVTQGALFVNNSSGSGLGTGSTNVSIGATLGGSGTIAGTVTVSSGAKLEPGSGSGVVGTLKFSGTLALSQGCVLNFDLNTTAASDKIALTGTYTAPTSGNVTVNFNALASFGAGTYTLITGATNITAAQFAVGSAPAGYSYALGATGGVLSVTVTALTPMEQWRLANFGTTQNTGDAADGADPDGDGMSNIQEFTAGTNPKDSGSVLKIAGVQANGSDMIVSFSTVSGKTYSLEFSNTLQVGSWNPVLTNGVPQQNISGTGSPVQVIDTGGAAQPQRFYRIVVGP